MNSCTDIVQNKAGWSLQLAPPCTVVAEAGPGPRGRNYASILTTVRGKLWVNFNQSVGGEL